MDYLEIKDTIKNRTSKNNESILEYWKRHTRAHGSSVLLEEKDLTAETVDVDIVKKKTNKWRAEFAAQTKEN